jgi:AbrB family looped-hinge helix DNA binding protein
MPVSTVSTKGQITLPAALRRQLGIKAHDRVVVGLAHGAIVIKPAGNLLELEGFLGKALPLEEEAKALARAAAERAAGTQS